MSSVRSGKAIRSVSRLPSLSNRHNSTLVALAENSAKFVPRPSQVAPSVSGAALKGARSEPRNEIDGSKRSEDKTKLRSAWRHNGVSLPTVPDVAATVVRSICIKNLAPWPGKRHPNVIVAAHLRREIDRHQTAIFGIFRFAKPREDAVVGV